MKSSSILRFVGGALLAVSLCGQAAFAQGPTTVRIGAASNVLFGPVFVLADSSNGIAARHGLKVESRIFNSGIATMEAALAGDLDVAFPNTRILLPLLKSGKACFKAGIAFVDVNTVGMVTRSSITQPRQLEGKKIGTRKGGIGEVALHMWLAKQGIPRDTVQTVNIAEEDLPIALAKGNVDGIIWPEPTPSQALEVGGSDVHRFGDIGSAFRDTSVVNVTCDWVKKNGDDAMQRLTAAWVDAVDLLKKNPDAGAAVTAKALQLTPDDVRKIWKNGGWPAGWPGTLTDGQIDMYYTYGDYLKANKEIDSMPDMGNWISSKWLKAVDPKRVQLSKYKL
ncbi:ABC transporter substrate-binding protein [Ramlibacter sp. G-1-2-2]|uniref:ABC transporter substrate-binding protein n=1 Tax=Ramlibacter agri TaxID=2728837 RepID=A0A848GYH8_9BURK|nr:ABC transporter substrate-binding protein [Ramlibacter agri]NML42342.1 ABC transporter substrate-binding protein [Ramlibacter agri]